MLIIETCFGNMQNIPATLHRVFLYINYSICFTGLDSYRYLYASLLSMFNLKLQCEIVGTSLHSLLTRGQNGV